MRKQTSLRTWEWKVLETLIVVQDWVFGRQQRRGFISTEGWNHCNLIQEKQLRPLRILEGLMAPWNSAALRLLKRLNFI